MIRRLLVAVEDAPVVPGAVLVAAELAVAFRAELRLISVLTPGYLVPGDGTVENENAAVEEVTRAQQYLAATLGTLSPGIRATARAVSGADLVDGVMEELASNQVDLLVVARRASSDAPARPDDPAVRLARRCPVPLLITT
jgi:hypothetical protein